MERWPRAGRYARDAMREAELWARSKTCVASRAGKVERGGRARQGTKDDEGPRARALRWGRSTPPRRLPIGAERCNAPEPAPRARADYRGRLVPTAGGNCIARLP